MEREAVEVAFRADRAGEFKDVVTAVFSGEDERTGELLCYGHVGQHGSCTRGWYQRTRPATPDEYADLLKELTDIGYDVTVVRRVRWSRSAYKARRAG